MSARRNTASSRAADVLTVVLALIWLLPLIFSVLMSLRPEREPLGGNIFFGSTLTLDAVTRQLELLERKSIAERRQIVGLEPRRADVIFAGACLLERIMSRYHADHVIVSDQGVRYGLLHEAAGAL